MSDATGLGFDRGDDTVALLADGTHTTRGQLRELSDGLLERMQGDGVKRVLVQSDDPADVLRAIDACSRGNAALWIAHTSLPQGYVDDICAQFGIQLRVGSRDEPLHAGTADAPVGASIHMMTSGTTGRPKIAAHTLDTLLGRVRTAAGLPQNQRGRWLLCYQTTGFAGVQVLLTAALSHGAIAVPRERTPAGFYSAAAAAKVTQISGTPTFWRSFLMVAEPGALQLRQITLGGEAVDQPTLDRVKAAFPTARVTHIYASTEAGAVFAVHDGRAGFPAAWLEEPIQGVQLRLSDGYLQIKSPRAMHRYVSETEQPHLDDGWIATADRCEIEGDRVRIIGRQDSTINVGGSKVYPLAVETILLDLPEVLEARVYGEPNPISGYLVAAEVVLAPDTDPAQAKKSILRQCRERLSGYQVPRVLQIVDSIRVHQSGKKG